MTNLIKNLEWYLLKVEGGTRNLQNQLYMRYIAAPALESNKKKSCANYFHTKKIVMHLSFVKVYKISNAYTVNLIPS